MAVLVYCLSVAPVDTCGNPCMPDCIAYTDLAGALAGTDSWAILFGLLLVLFLIDTIVFCLFRFHLNGMVWSLVVNGWLDQILPLSLWTWALGLILPLWAFGLELWLGVWIWRWVSRSACLCCFLFVAGIILAVIENTAYAWAEAVHYTPITRYVRVLPGYPPLSAKRGLVKLGLIKPTVEADPVIPVVGSSLNYPLRPLICHVPSEPLNLLVIAIDEWRFDMLTDEATPSISRLARQRMLFQRHSSTANATRFGIFALFYGLYGTYWHAMLAEERGPVLIDELVKAGYQFGVFASAPLTNPEFNRTVFAQVRHQIPLYTEGPTATDRDKAITTSFLQFIADRDPTRPFFGILFYDSTHAYDYPPDSPVRFQLVCNRVKYLKLNNATDPIPIKNRFLNALYFVDGLVGKVLDSLRAESLLDKTVVIVTADHGEQFNEGRHNSWGHNSNFSRFQTQVPLVL